jgi:oligopeptide/dipeptide ABC transporter ATP-binding protein
VTVTSEADESTQAVTTQAPLLQVDNLCVQFRPSRRNPPVHAVDCVSLSVAYGETVGLVGESGSGKTTLGLAILGLVRPTSGTVRFDGRDITYADRATRRQLSRELQVVFQNPYGSLSPTRTIGQTLAEPLLAGQRERKAVRSQAAAAMLQRVGLAEEALRRYPSEFSGGQRQRIAIARALMCSPRLVICDEPVSGLDLSVQAQVLNLLRQLQRDMSLSYLFVAHNLAVVQHMSHRVVVLYRGRVMETGPANVVYQTPSHPYTQALLDAAPVVDPDIQRQRRAVRAATPAAAPLPPTGGGCPFVTRCPYMIEDCRRVRPPLIPSSSGSLAACIRIGDMPVASPAARSRYAPQQLEPLQLKDRMS